MKNKSVSAKKNSTTSRAVRALRYCAVPFAALFGVSASAATIVWDGGDGAWDTAANWSTALGAATPNPAAAPGAADAALFNITGANGNETVALGANQSAGSLTFSNTGTTTIKSDSTTLRYLTLGSGGINIDAPAGAVTIGDATNLTSLWLAYGQTWTNNSGSLLTVVNPIYNGAATLTVGGSGNTTISGAISGTFSGAGSGGVTKTGAGTLTLGGNNNFTGAVSVTGGTMLIKGTNAWTGASTVNNGATLQFSGASGTNTGASAYTLNLGGSMIVDNTDAAGGNNNTRIADGSAFTLNGGSLIYKGADAAATNSTETIGALSGIGNSTITVTFGGTNVATLTAGAFTHAAGNATNLVNGVNLGMDSTSTASVARFISTTPTLVGTTAALTSGINSAVKNTQIVPFLLGEATSTTGGLGTASGTANTFVTYVAGSGYRPLNLTDEFTANTITATHNIWLNTGPTVTSTAAINSLVMGGGSLTITDGQTLTNSSGAILFTSTGAINPSSSTGALAFAAVEPQITVNSGFTGTISTNITGSAGLTKSGAGILALSGSVANAYTGTTTVNAGTLQLGKSGAVQALSGALTIGSTLTSLAPVVQYTGASSDMMGTGAVTINSAGQLDFNGKTDTIGAVTINATGATGNTTHIANTAGGGAITITTLGITPAAGFTSRINSSTGTLTLNNNVTFTAAGSGQAQLSGALTWGADRTFTVGAGTAADYDMLIDASLSGSTFRFIKSGAGTLKFAPSSAAYTGGTQIDAGTLRLGASDVLPNTGILGIGSGANNATLDLNGFSDQIQGIYFGVANAGTTSTITTGLGTLTISGTAGPNGHHIGTDSGSAMTKIINGRLDFAGGSRDIANTTSVDFIINAAIQNGGVIHNGGTVKYTGASTYAGGTTLTSGLFGVGAASAGSAGSPTSGPLGTGTVTFNNNGGISSDSTTARTILNPIAFTTNANGTIGNATNNGALTFAGGIDLNTNAHTLTLNSDVLITGTITGSGTITKAGTGTLTITPTTSNNYTGSLIAAAGILRAGATNAFSTTGDIGASGSGTLDLNGFDVTVNNIRFITNAAGETSSIVTGNNTLTLNGGMNQFDSSAPGSRLISGKLKLGVGNHAISGAGGAALTISALISGTDGTSALSNSSQIVILNNANTYQGGTNVNGGTFRVGINSAGTAPSVTSGAFGTGTLTLTSGTVSSDGTTARTVGNAITFAGNITLGDATNTGKLTFGADVNLGAATRTLTLNSDAEISGIISNGGLTKSGTGTLTLSGNNIYTTLTTVSAGKLILSGSNASAIGGMTLSGGVTQFNSVASINGTTQNVTVTGPGAVVFGPAFETGTDIPTALASRIVASSTGAIATDNYASTSFDFSTAGLTAASLGAVGNVTYTGTLTPNGTTYRLGGGGGTLVFTPAAYTNTNDLVLFGNSNTGTVDFGGLSKSFGAITFAGGTTKNGTLTGTSYTNVTGAVVNASLAGSGAFTVVGTVTLNGNNSGYSGAFNNSGATLKAVDSRSLGSGLITLSGSSPTLSLTNDGTGTGLGNGSLQFINYAKANPTDTTTASSTNSTTLAVADGTKFAIGQTITGTGIADNTRVTAISGNNLTLSQAATVANGATITPYLASNVAATVASTITVGQFTAPAGTNTLNAVNKTLMLGTLATGATTLTVTNSNKFGLEFTGTTTLSGTAAAGTTFSVGTANASTEVFGLTLNGLVSAGTTSAVNDAVILTKSGAGTLLLKGANSSFGGTSGATGQIINITDGYLAAGTDAALGVTGATGNLVQISANNATKGFLATGTFSTDRTFKLNAAANGLDVTQGNTLTLSTAFALSAVTNGLQKNDIGTLELSNNNSTMTTGNFVVSQGVLKVSNASALGVAGTTSNGFTQVAASTHAAIQLNGTSGSPLSIGEYFKIAGYGMNNGGALQAVGGGTSTITGTLDLSADGSLGAETGSTLTIGSAATFPVGGNTMNIVGGGTINVNTTINSTTNGMNIYGPGALNFNTTATPQFNRGFSLNGGMAVTLSGTTAFKLGSGAGFVTTFTVNGSSITLDNSTNAVANRFGGSASVVPTLARTSITLTGGGSIGEAFGALTLGSGLSTFTTTGANAGNVLSFLSQASRPAGAVVNVSSAGSSSVRFATTSPTLTPATTGILPGWFVGSDFATIAGGAANTAVTAFSSYTTGDLGTVVATTGTFKPSGVQTSVNTKTINALNLTSSVGVTIGAGQTLTLTAGGLINDGGGNISGGFLTPSAELIAKYVTNGSISSSITSAQSLTKLGAGNLTLSATADTQFTVGSTQNSYTGTTTINEGTLTLAGGNNTLNVNRVMVLNGGTLALGSNNQYVGSFTSNTTAALGYGGSGGNVSGTGTLTTNAANGTFAGNLGWDGAAATALNFVKAGANTLTLTNANSTTGAISVIGGGLTLRDDGSLLGIDSLAIRNATLTLDNGSTVSASKDVADRVKNTATISMDGGLITYQGRVGFNSAESLGAVTVNSGQASFSAIQGATGVNSAQLTLASLTRSTGAVVNLQRLNPTNTSNLGLIGSNPRIVVTDGQTTVGGIVPGVFFAERDFVGYAPGLGFGRLGTVGFPAYYTTSASVSLASSPSTGNVKLAVSGAVASGGQTINALNADVYDVTFAGANDVLTLTSGMYTNMQSHSIGTTAVRGVLTSGSSELFLNAWHNSGSGVTVHSKITGTNMLVMSSDGNGGNPPFRLTNSANDYTGGTVVNSGLGITSILTLDNAVSAVYVPNATVPANGLVLNNSQAIMTVSQGQIGSSNIVTLNGASTLTLFGNNTLAGLVINSNGGTGTPTVNPGGSLTLTGNITSTPSNVAVTPVIGVAANGGNLNFGGSTRTVTVNAYTEGTYTNGATLVGLNIVAPIQNGSLTKQGAGLLQLTGSNVYTGTTTITTGAIQANAANTFSPFSPVSLANTAGVLLDLNSQANTIGSLTGGGTTGGNVAVLGTTALTLGGDNTSPTAFLGNIIGNGAGTLTKIGSGTQILAGTNTITGTITVRNGTLQIGNATVGTLNGTTGNALTFNGTGTFNVSEASGVSQGMGALNFTAGNGTVQSTNNGGSSFLTFTSRARTAGGTANFVVTNGTNGTDNKIVLTGTSANSFIDQGTFFQGGAYAWYDSNSYVRAIQYTGSPDAGTATSSGAASLANTTHQQITGSITAQNTATFTTFNISGNSDVTLASGQTVTLNGLLKTGNNAATISGGLGLTTAAEFVIRTNEASDALTISTPILGGNALTKAGAGTLTLSAPNTYTGTTTVNQGTLALRGGMNALVVNTAMVVQNGGTLDLGVNSQYVGALTSAGTFEGNGGTITGTSGTFTTNGSSTTFGGNFTGSVNLTKAGTGTMTLSSASDTTGAVNIIGTGLTLKDGGAFTGSTGVNVKFSTFTIDNTGTKDMTDRVSNAAPITLDGGNVFFNGRAAFNSTETLGAVTASSGVSSISATIGTGGSAELTLTSLTRNTGAELWLNRNNSGTLGLVGNNARIIVTGGPTGNLAPINGVVPGAFTNAGVDTYHMVGYVSGLGFGALGSTGFPAYYSGLAGATSTSNVSGGGAVNAGGQTINSIGGSAQAAVTFDGATDLLTINSGMAIMQNSTWGTTALRGKVTSGTQELFIMHRDGNANPDPTVNSVIVDKGPNPSDKVSVIFHTPRQDRGFYVHLTAANTYSGGTFVNSPVSGQSGISLDATTDGTVVIPAGGLTINDNGLVDMTGRQGQIDSSNVVTINGGGQLNLMGINTLAGIVFNSNGGTTQPKVTPYNALVASATTQVSYGSKTGTLFITGNITSNPSNVAVTPLIDGGTLDFNASTNHTITVDQLYTSPAATPAALPSVVGLNISAVIQGIGAGFTKQGVGYLQLSGANTYTGGTTVSAGTLVAQAANNLSATAPLTVNGGGSFSMVNGAAVTTYVTAALTLGARSNLTFDWAGGSVDKLTSTAAATAPSSNVGISINPTSSPSGTGLQLLAAPSGLTSSGTNYFLANNTNYTATLTQSDTSVTIGSYAAAAPLTSAYWIGGQVTNALGAMAFSSGTASNWAKDAAGTSAGGVVPGLGANVYFSTTSGATEQSNVVLGNSMTVNSLTFSDTIPVTIGADGSYLTLYSSGTAASSAISANESAIINAKVVLGSNQTWTVASTKTLTVGGDVSGTSGLTKDGTGKLILSGTDTYNGATIVNAGTLLVSGSISGSAVTVKSGGTLGTQSGAGGGTTGSVSVLSGGTLAPGASTGLMTVNGNLTIASGGIFAAEVNTVATPGSPVAGTEYDRVSVAGTVNLTASTLSLSGTYAGANGSDTFYLILNDGTDAVTGTFNGLAQGASVNIGAQYFNITYVANGDSGSVGNDVALIAVPEPGAAVSLLGGLGLLLGARRRRRA